MNNYKLTLSYDGSRYRGWQRQGNTENTIQGKVEAALSRILGQEIEISGSGRTDAGAHARMQVASFRAEMLMYGKEASNRKQEIDRQHYTIPNQRPKDKHCGKI